MSIRRDERGFTLIELLIVVVVVGILAMLAIPRFTGVSKQSKQAEALPILKQICVLAEADRLRTGQWQDGEPTGWTDPSAKYFTFGFAGGTASASPLNPQEVDAVALDCETLEEPGGGD